MRWPARLISKWYLRKARRIVARFLDGRTSLDDAAREVWPALDRYGFYHHLSVKLPLGSSASLEAFSLAPDGSFAPNERIDKLVQRSWELGMGPDRYKQMQAFLNERRT